MLKPIKPVSSAPALAACRNLMEHLLAWLCDANVDSNAVVEPKVIAMGGISKIEGQWLWRLLQSEDGKQPLAQRAKLLAGMTRSEKAALQQWASATSKVEDQFKPNPSAWPTTKPAIHPDLLLAFKQLFEAFYTKGFSFGLPYKADGTLASVVGVDRASFVDEFRQLHRKNPGSIDLCVFCGGELGDVPEVDHWINKAEYPMLSMCKNNLIPICHTCNSTSYKGKKPVHSKGCFVDWFHPYLRPGHGKVRVAYRLPLLAVSCKAVCAADDARAERLDDLLKLSARWTPRFKAEYLLQQDELIRREKEKLKKGKPASTQKSIQKHLKAEQAKLRAERPWFEVHQELFEALQHKSRLAAWQTELGLK